MTSPGSRIGDCVAVCDAEFALIFVQGIFGLSPRRCTLNCSFIFVSLWLTECNLLPVVEVKIPNRLRCILMGSIHVMIYSFKFHQEDGWSATSCFFFFFLQDPTLSHFVLLCSVAPSFLLGRGNSARALPRTVAFRNGCERDLWERRRRWLAGDQSSSDKWVKLDTMIEEYRKFGMSNDPRRMWISPLSPLSRVREHWFIKTSEIARHLRPQKFQDCSVL